MTTSMSMMVLSVVFLLAGGVHLRLEWPLLVRERPQCHYQPSKHPKASPIFGLHHKDTRLYAMRKHLGFYICFLSAVLWEFHFPFLLECFCRILLLTYSVIQWDWSSFEFMNMSVHQTQYCFHCCAPLFFNLERTPSSFKPWTSSAEL